MKAFQKLALVSAMTVVSSAYALEAADDATLSAATGQDGITIIVKPGVITAAQATTFGVSAATQNLVDNPSAGYYANNDDNFAGLTINQVKIHDDDGIGYDFSTGASVMGSSATANSGALVIGDGSDAQKTVVLADGSKPIQIDIDMVGDIDGAGAGGAMLNVRISTPRLAIKTGDIYVANSNASPLNFDADGAALAGAEVNGSTTSNPISIMSGLELVMGAGVTTIQLGSEAQGAMIKLDTAFVGGLTINNLALKDAGGTLNPTPLGTVVTTGGSLYVGSLSIKDNGGSNLTMKANVDVGSVSTTNFTAGETSVIKDNMAIAVGAADYTSATLGQKALVDGNFATTEATAQNIYNGLVVQVVQMGDATNGADLAMNNVRVGDSSAKDIGDIQILGLNLNGSTLVIMGH
jgi:hypothetical protein